MGGLGMSKSTKDCKDFLVGFFKDNPQIMKTLFGLNDPGEEAETQAFVTTAANWKRVSKRRPDEDDVKPMDETKVGIFKSGAQPNRYCETTDSVPVSRVEWVREFRCGDDTDIGFLVIEMKDGTLHLGPHRD